MSKPADVPENLARCICGGCPSYPGEGALFCATGSRAKEAARLDCVCADCAVFKQYDLLSASYCADGACGACGEGPQ